MTSTETINLLSQVGLEPKREGDHEGNYEGDCYNYNNNIYVYLNAIIWDVFGFGLSILQGTNMIRYTCQCGPLLTPPVMEPDL